MACGSEGQGRPEKSDPLFQGQSAAGKLKPADVARCHAVGQACGVVHTAGHALGHPMYELTAIVLEQEPNLSAGWADFLRK